MAMLEELVNEVECPMGTKTFVALISPPVALVNSFKTMILYEGADISLHLDNSYLVYK